MCFSSSEFLEKVLSQFSQRFNWIHCLLDLKQILSPKQFLQQGHQFSLQDVPTLKQVLEHQLNHSLLYFYYLSYRPSSQEVLTWYLLLHSPFIIAGIAQINMSNWVAQRSQK